jgi:Predicted permeases
VTETAGLWEIFRHYNTGLMKRWREVIGLIATAILFLSSGAHTILGWKSLEPRIASFGTPKDLITGLRIGWQWGGVAMLALGIIAASIFIQRFRGAAVSMFPVRVIGFVYVAFGAWALNLSGDPFFAIFIVPGVLLLLASLPNHRSNHANDHVE